MCVGPLQSQAWLDRGEARRPPLRKPAACYLLRTGGGITWQSHPRLWGPGPRRHGPAGTPGRGLVPSPRCSAPAGQRHTAAAAAQRPRVWSFCPTQQKGSQCNFALPLLHYTPMRWDVILRARNARVLSFARACFSPYTPRGTALASVYWPSGRAYALQPAKTD